MAMEENLMRKFRKEWRELRNKLSNGETSEAEYVETAIKLTDNYSIKLSGISAFVPDKIKTFLLHEYSKEHSIISDRIILKKEIDYNEYQELTQKLFWDYAFLLPKSPSNKKELQDKRRSLIQS